MEAQKETQTQAPDQLPKWRQWIRRHQTALTATATAAISYLAGNGTIHTIWQAFLSMFGF